MAIAKILKSKGVEFAAEPKSEVWGTMAIFKDSEGISSLFPISWGKAVRRKNTGLKTRHYKEPG